MSSSIWPQTVADVLDALGPNPTANEVYDALLNFDTRYAAAAIAAQAYSPAGSGTISEITSDDDSVTITGGTGPTADLSVSGGSQPDVGAATGAIIQCFGMRGHAGVDAETAGVSSIELGATAEGMDSLIPWFLPAPIATASFNFQSGTNVAGLYRLGLYAADAHWQPDALLWQSGEEDASDTTFKTSAMPLTLPAGRYFQAFCCDQNFVDNGGVVQGLKSDKAGVIYVNTGVASGDLSDGVPVPIAFLRTRAFGAFPDPGDPWDDVHFDATPGAFGALWATLA